MAKLEAPGNVAVTVVYSSAPREVREWQIELAPGAVVVDALNATAFKQDLTLRATRPIIGVWGKKSGLQHGLQSGDRVEIYRPLLVDPKTARRERFKQQGAKSAGLFKSRRAGAKAGY
jgi:putative ubiquitin-RnfH superfamily antitoxin RatB of RatAB toxin-antitoxin module